VTSATVLVGPLLGLAMLATGYLAQRSPELAYRAVLALALVLFLLALSLATIRSPAPRPNKAPYDWRRLFALLPAAFVQTLSMGVLTPVLFLFVARVDLSLPRLVFLIAAGAGAALLVFWRAARRADEGEPKRLLVPGLFLAALGFTLVGVLPLLFGPALWTLGLAGALVGTGFGLFFPGWNGLVVKSLPDADRAAAWGAIMTLEALGYAVGPAIGGVAWDLLGPWGPFATGGMLMALVGGYYLWQLGKQP